MLKKNESIPLEITGLTHEGNGVGRHEGMAVFVPMTAPGDRILAKIVQVRSRFAYGIVEQLLEPSGDRFDNQCPVYRQCGGCSLRHMTYEAELREKRGWVEENLRRIGGIDLPVEGILASPHADRYRNKAQYPVRRVDGKIRAGFFAKRSHRLIPVEDCLLQPAEFRDIIRAVLEFMENKGMEPYDEAQHSGLVRHIFLRKAETTGQLMVWLVLRKNGLPHWQELVEQLRQVCPGLTSFGIDGNPGKTNVIFGGRGKTLWGKDFITDEICGVRVNLSVYSFYQVNRPAAEQLYRAALEMADPQPEDVLLDLYCGTGTIGLSMAHRVQEVIGVEVVPQAVEDARRNAEQNGIENARFLLGDASQAVEQLQQEGIQPDIMVLDPPRKGVSAEVIRSVGQFAPRKVVYISCNSATLARDCQLLEGEGYRVKAAKAADLFPRTAHVEAVALLERV